MDRKSGFSQSLAEDITRAASKQTYYTIRFLVDRGLVADAYRAYAYFRWVDDALDTEAGLSSERAAFLERQQSLLEACYRGQAPAEISPEEQMLVDLVGHDTEKNSGLQAYLRNMMAVMAFDVARRGRSISQEELTTYARTLATAVTEALHFFIGHDCPAPCDETRYLAVQGAHVIHMLRDLLEDAEIGYFNIPREYLEAKAISLQDVDQPAYRKWVYGRVQLARSYFRVGRGYLGRVKSLRCRFAGFAYIARFEWMADAFERDGYRLRPAYAARKSVWAGLWMAWRTLFYASGLFRLANGPRQLAT
jgi:phytoene/squalene synthetase